jgi:hypothetical protein
MYVQHLQTAFWRGGGETLVGQRVPLYKDDVRPTPADHLLERRGRKKGQNKVCLQTSVPSFANKKSQFPRPPANKKKTKNHNFPDPPNHQPIPPHKPNLMKSKMYQKIVISVFLLRIHWDNSRVFLN